MRSKAFLFFSTSPGQCSDYNSACYTLAHEHASEAGTSTFLYLRPEYSRTPGRENGLQCPTVCYLTLFPQTLVREWPDVLLIINIKPKSYAAGLSEEKQ